MPRHIALLYRSQSEYLSALVPFLVEGLAAGEPVLVACNESRAGLLEEAIGGEASQVAFVQGVGTAGPAAAIAAYRRLFDAHLAEGAAQIRLVGEVEPGLGPAEHLAWAQYEAAMSAAFATTPVTIVCPYDVESVPPAFLQRVAHTHPYLWEEGRRSSNARFAEPAAVLRDLQVGAMPVESFPPALELRIGPTVSIPRDALRAVATRAGLGPDRLEDLLLAFTEVATNALVHGSSVAKARVWASNGTVVCTVSDTGSGMDDPLAGLVPPPREEDLDPGGLGLWVARQLCDAVDLIPGPEGLTVRLVVRR